MFFIRYSDKENIWTVGCRVPATLTEDATWTTLKDCTTAEEAMQWIHYLNGGKYPLPSLG